MPASLGDPAPRRAAAACFARPRVAPILSMPTVFPHAVPYEPCGRRASLSRAGLGSRFAYPLSQLPVHPFDTARPAGRSLGRACARLHLVAPPRQ